MEPEPPPGVIIADKGYDSAAIRCDLAVLKVEAVIPMHRNRKTQTPIDRAIYALRNPIERCFSKFGHSRRLASRYDNTAESYLCFVLFASDRLCCRHFGHAASGIVKDSL